MDRMDLVPTVLGAVAAFEADGLEVLTGSTPGCDQCDKTMDWAKGGVDEDEDEDED